MTIYEYLEKLEKSNSIRRKLQNAHIISPSINQLYKGIFPILSKSKSNLIFGSNTNGMSSILPYYTKILSNMASFNSQYKGLENNFIPIKGIGGLNNILKENILLRLREALNAQVDEISTFEYLVDDLEESDKNSPLTNSRIVVGNRAIKIIQSAYHDQNLLKIIDPREFEEVVAELLYNKGFVVELTKQTRDGGYDILALKEIGGFQSKFLVECKRFTNNAVGIDIIRSFCDVIKEERANKGIIFTTSYFSPEAHKRKQKEGTLLDLINREELINWVIDYNLGN